jgi:hypothetical protein
MKATLQSKLQSTKLKMRLPSAIKAITLTVVAWQHFVGLLEGQGTFTFTFEGQPLGMLTQVGTYQAAGVQFVPIAPGSLWLSGSGVAGYPDNGTGYLYMPDGNLGGLRFTYNADFNLVSFDAAEYANTGPVTLTVVGYRDDVMGLRVTNYFTLDGINDGTGPLQDFQTFYLDSNFIHLGRVDVLNARWSLDNLVISGVPEPSLVAMLGMAVIPLAVRRSTGKGREG